MMFNKILIANRGEIALRIINTCRKMGIETVAVYSESEIRSIYVQKADSSAFIGKDRPKESFLNGEKLISIALKHGCQAVHPGYGFLSENANFSKMVEDAGLTFIGPSHGVISTLGDKMASKALAKRIGVPVVPGNDQPLNTTEEILAMAKEIGFPVLLKPAAGGGGRGMRIVTSEDELVSNLMASRDETRKGFADDRIFVERYIAKPRHIEFQIIADNYGNTIHLGERECSIQRRYQKVIEETPSPAMDSALRAKIGAYACAIAKEANYRSAGTCEFIMDQDKNFYFLEMNTRLQVEHPITEFVTSLDLVELQLRIASGEALALKQEDIEFKGSAIEARICAEDPYKGFLPTTGLISRYAMPKGSNVRVDSGIDAGSMVTIHFDSLLAKVAVWGESRANAIQTMIKALNGYHIEGLTTNVDFANAIMNHPAFANAELSTDFISDHFIDGFPKDPPDLKKLHYITIASVLVYHTRQQLIKDSLKPMTPVTGGRLSHHKKHNYVVKIDNNTFEISLYPTKTNRQWSIQINNESYEVTTPEFEYYRRRLKLDINGVSQMFRLSYKENHTRVSFCGLIMKCEIYSPKEWDVAKYMLHDRKEVQENSLKCPMPGLITAICVKEGDHVNKRQELVRMESMKMETGVASPCNAQIDKILIEPGEAVDTSQILITFKL